MLECSLLYRDDFGEVKERMEAWWQSEVLDRIPCKNYSPQKRNKRIKWMDIIFCISTIKIWSTDIWRRRKEDWRFRELFYKSGSSYSPFRKVDWKNILMWWNFLSNVFCLNRYGCYTCSVSWRFIEVCVYKYYMDWTNYRELEKQKKIWLQSW